MFKVNREKSYWRTELVTWLAAYKSTPQVTTPFYPTFGRKMRTKSLELRRETAEVPREEVRDRNASNKLKGHASSRVAKSIRIVDTVPLKAEKSFD